MGFVVSGVRASGSPADAEGQLRFGAEPGQTKAGPPQPIDRSCLCQHCPARRFAALLLILATLPAAHAAEPKMTQFA